MALLDLGYILSAVIEIILPIILAIIIWKKFKVSWAIFFLGLILFIASLIRIPLNNYISVFLKTPLKGELYIIIIGIIAGFSAGIFEEGVRCIAFGAVIRPRDYYKGIMYGIGHGGGESMIFVGFSVLANYIVYKFFPNILPSNIISQFKSSAWWLPLVGAGERILAITIQIAFSVLIMHAFIYKKFYIIPLTILFHALIDFTAYYVNYKLGMLYAELSVVVFAVAAIAVIFLLQPKKYKHAKL